MIRLNLKHCLPGPYVAPASVDEQLARYRQILYERHDPPTNLRGHGIVMCCDDHYWPMACVGVRLMREIGVDCPIQVWHFGRIQNDLKGLADVVDVAERVKSSPARRYWHFQAKTYALMGCGFEEAIHLDADAYLVTRPDKWFSATRQHGFVSHRDTSHYSDSNTNRRIFDFVANWVPCIQGGTYSIDLRTTWHELVCAVPGRLRRIMENQQLGRGFLASDP